MSQDIVLEIVKAIGLLFAGGLLKGLTDVRKDVRKLTKDLNAAHLKLRELEKEKRRIRVGDPESTNQTH